MGKFRSRMEENVIDGERGKRIGEEDGNKRKGM